MSITFQLNTFTIILPNKKSPYSRTDVLLYL